MVFDQNYIKIEISGAYPGDRIAAVTCYTVDNRVKWTYRIRQKELK
jgi:hypothetical protein